MLYAPSQTQVVQQQELKANYQRIWLYFSHLIKKMLAILIEINANAYFSIFVGADPTEDSLT